MLYIIFSSAAAPTILSCPTRLHSLSACASNLPPLNPPPKPSRPRTSTTSYVLPSRFSSLFEPLEHLSLSFESSLSIRSSNVPRLTALALAKEWFAISLVQTQVRTFRLLHPSLPLLCFPPHQFSSLSFNFPRTHTTFLPPFPAPSGPGDAREIEDFVGASGRTCCGGRHQSEKSQSGMMKWERKNKEETAGQDRAETLPNHVETVAHSPFSLIERLLHIIIQSKNEFEASFCCSYAHRPSCSSCNSPSRLLSCSARKPDKGSYWGLSMTKRRVCELLTSVAAYLLPFPCISLRLPWGSAQPSARH